MLPTTRVLLVLAVGASAFAACAGGPAAVERSRALRVQCVPGGAPKFTQVHRVTVTCVGPGAVRCEANGVIAPGGTVRALCASLQSSLRARGIAAVYRDSRPDGDELARAMDQTLELADGWFAVAPPVVEGLGGSAVEVVVTLR